MTRKFPFLAVVVLTLFSSTLLLAQSDPLVGTWKLNLAKSNFGPGQAPKSMTRTVVAQGKGSKSTFEGIGPDGSKASYGFATNYDGKDSPLTGAGQPNGADTIAVTRVDANTLKAVNKKAGKEVATTTTTISKDGKTMTINSKGVAADGKPRNVTSVWEKQ